MVDIRFPICFFSLFHLYDSASVQHKNCLAQVKGLPAIPNMPWFHRIKVVRAPARYKHTQHRHNHGCCRQKWPPNTPNEASSPVRKHWTDGWQLPEQANMTCGEAGGCMAIKALLYSSDDASPQHWSVLIAIHSLNPPKIISACLGGHHPSSKDDGAR